MKWVLLITLISSAGNQVTPVSMDSEELCKIAAQQVIANWGESSTNLISEGSFVICMRSK